jgi:hypothetical protein
MAKIADHSNKLNFVFAREAPVAVIFNRKSRRWIQLVRWNTDTDEFESGHWLQGKIYAERCDLSPDGRYLVYFALKQTGVNFSAGYRRTFTAVSKPPWFSALALWPWTGTWGGGGRFNTNTELCLGCRLGLFPPHPDHLPIGLQITDSRTERLEYGADKGYRLDNPPIDNTQWFGIDQAGKMIFVRDGKLFRLNENGSDKLLVDFNNSQLAFQDAPSWAKHW